MSRKILIVDDEPAICGFLRVFFQDRGYLVAVAHNGTMALQQLEIFEPPVVLLDIRMPGMDGLETLRKIKSFDPQVKVIMVTGAGDQAEIEEATRLGADSFITKPLNLEYLEKDVQDKIDRLSKKP